MKEEMREKKKMKTTEGRKSKIIYVWEREVSLQLNNLLSWWQIISQQSKTKRKAVKEINVEEIRTI